MDAASRSARSPLEAAQFRSSIHAGAGELIGAKFEVRSVPAAERSSACRSSGRGERMSSMDYAGPDRRRQDRVAGPERRPRSCLGRPRAVPRRDAPDLEREAGFEIIGEPMTLAAPSTCPSAVAGHHPHGPVPACPGWHRDDPADQARAAVGGNHLLAVSEDEDALFDAIKAGAAAFILKDVAPDDLVAIIPRRQRRVPDQRQGLCQAAVASRVLKEFRNWPSTARKRRPSSRLSLLAKSRSSTTSPRA